MEKNKEKKLFGLSPNIFFLGLVSLFNETSSAMVYSVMPAFLTVVLGVPPILVSFIEGFADALASFLKIYFGWLSDRLRKRKKLAVIGYAISTSTRWFLALVGNFWQVFILRSIDRVGKGLRDSPRDALISESLDGDGIGHSFGYHRAMDTIGAVIGPLLAVLLLPLIVNDYRFLFKIGFVIGILSIITFIFVRDKKINEPTDKSFTEHFSLSLGSYSYSFKIYILSIFIFGLGFMPLALILLKSQDIGLSIYNIPLMYFIYNLSFVFFAVPAGNLSDRIGEYNVLVYGFLAAIIAYIVFIFSIDIFGIIIAFILLGLYSAMTDGIERALASKLVPQSRLAAGQGFLNAAVGMSSLLAAIIGGFLWTYFSPTLALLYGLVMMGLGTIAFIHFNRHEVGL
ncbi:MFS transporter [Candidatus Wolfebacteria bacterium]|nr:MFS transporter [Candidatus Wolfebacteria bacterium]